MLEIKVTLYHLYTDRPGTRVPFRNYYECTGPDGRQFTNTNKGTLRNVLRKRYGPVKLVVDDQRLPVNEY